MSVLRIRAFEKLADAIACEVPELSGQICPTPSDPGHLLEFPSLAMTPLKFKYEPMQATEWRDINNSTVIMEVGKHECIVQLRLGATTNYQRALIEQKLVNMFLSRPGAPGVYVIQVSDCYDAVCSFELEDTVWESEKAFDSKWFTTITLNAILPALVCRKGVYTIQQLRVGLTDNFNDTFNDTLYNDPVYTEVVEINQDGTISLPS